MSTKRECSECGGTEDNVHCVIRSIDLWMCDTCEWMIDQFNRQQDGEVIHHVD